jgi:hypothetical protein
MLDKMQDTQNTSQHSDIHVPPDRHRPAETSEARPKRRHRWIVVLVLFAILFVWSVGREAPLQPEAGRHAMSGPVPVTIATAKLGSIGSYLDAIGTGLYRFGDCPSHRSNNRGSFPRGAIAAQRRPAD